MSRPVARGQYSPLGGCGKFKLRHYPKPGSLDGAFCLILLEWMWQELLRTFISSNPGWFRVRMNRAFLATCYTPAEMAAGDMIAGNGPSC